MKVFLVGEFSGVHAYIKKGLVEKGHSVTIASTGDGFKNYDCDIKININYKNKYLRFIINRLKYLVIILSIRNYDVVQFMHTNITSFPYWLKNIVIWYLKKVNRKVFVLVSGGDSYVIPYLMDKLLYTPHLNEIKENNYLSKYKNMSKGKRNKTINIMKKYTGIISIAYSYHIPYKQFVNYRGFIPMPTDKFKFIPNSIKNNKIRILHGILRKEVKGSSYILAALDIVKKKYPNQVEIQIVEKIPYNNYLEILENCNILIDQACSYGYGMNGLIALANGKTVLSGREPEIEELFGGNCPVINIKPEINDIYKKIEYLIQNKEEIEKIGKESYIYANNIHNYAKIADKYIEIWSID